MQAHINGIGTEFSINGDAGPWVVMSHSLGCDISMWDRQMASLTQRCRVLRYDTRGHGRSGATAGPYSLDMLADDAVQLMAHLGIQRAHWVGFSMGGMIGQTVALNHPTLLESIVLADSTSAHTATPTSMWQERIQIAKAEGMAPLVEPALSRWFTERFRIEHAEEVQKLGNIIRATSVDGWAGCCAAISEIETTDRLSEIECPALVMVGEHDIGTPISAALDMHRNLKNSVLAVISDAAHMTCIEQPSQFNRALAIFLDSFQSRKP
ncbi:alpha/beta fold hydrolase [Cupriavidus basilensis]|uniref:alpha/beta fold hydrolase n=1 Tax=Cupriavidus basilensis TaxID=68895 RepID=UPI0039F6CBAB